MGEIADDILDGTICQYCGVWHDEIQKGGPDQVFTPQGFPWTCKDCEREAQEGQTQ